MPQRKKQQYYARRKSAPATPGAQQQVIDQAVDRAARDLLLNYGPAELHAFVQRSREACQVADQEAQAQPSPEALRRYHAAERRVAEGERALSLINENPDD